MLRIKDGINSNATTATTLQTARTINGTSFNGSANVTTANWGTARTITIGSTGKSVNGSANVSWSLSEIGAAASSHNHDSVYMKQAYENSYYGMTSNGSTTGWVRTTDSGIIPYKSGGASSLGTSSWPFTNIYANNIYDNGTLLEDKFAPKSHTHSYLALSGGTLTGNISYTLYSSTQTPVKIYGGDTNGQGISIGAGGATIISSGEGKTQIESNLPATTETTAIGSDNTIEFYTALQNGWDSRKTMSMGADGKLTNSNGFVGALSGNATTATTLQTARTINGTSFNGSANITTANWGTARTITIGSTGKSVNGSANVSWSLSEIGAAASSHTHTTVGSYMGISNTTGTNGYGISLYGGATAGAPSYGIMFQQTGTWGTHGSVTSDWATYFTMSGSTSRGWIFKAGNAAGGNVASISATGVVTAPTFSGALSGNASTATKLQTARTINGTNFDGSGAITTANWGTARTITIGSTGKSVNGSGNVSWSLSEIGAAAASHTHSNISLTAAMTSSVTTSSHLNGNKGTAIINSTAAGTGYNMLAKMKSTNGVWTFGSYGTNFNFYYTADTVISAGTNSVTKTLTLLNESGNSTFPGTVTAPTFSGALSGNASTATTLATARTINGTSFNGSANITTANWGTARTITIGSTGKSVNGSGNVSWSLSEIGAAAASHTHSYASTTHTHTASALGIVTKSLWSGALSGTSSITVTNGANYNYILVAGRPGGASCEAWVCIPRTFITTTVKYTQITTELGYIKFGISTSGTNVIITRNAGSGNITMVYGGM